jgi:hypothetical protein
MVLPVKEFPARFLGAFAHMYPYDHGKELCTNSPSVKQGRWHASESKAGCTVRSGRDLQGTAMIIRFDVTDTKAHQQAVRFRAIAPAPSKTLMDYFSQSGTSLKIHRVMYTPVKEESATTGNMTTQARQSKGTTPNTLLAGVYKAISCKHIAAA